MDYNPPGSCSWDSPGKNTGVVAISFSRDVPSPRVKPAFPMSPHWKVDSLSLAPPGKLSSLHPWQPLICLHVYNCHLENVMQMESYRMWPPHPPFSIMPLRPSMLSCVDPSYCWLVFQDLILRACCSPRYGVCISLATWYQVLKWNNWSWYSGE